MRVGRIPKKTLTPALSRGERGKDRTLPVRAALWSVLGLLAIIPPARGQDDDLVYRPPPQKLEDFETDADNDGIPDGWYNVRDGTIGTGGPIKPACLHFANEAPGRPARASRAFGVDGRKYEALIVGLWIRLKDIRSGERTGQEPGLIIDFFGPELRATGRGLIGPWPRPIGKGWVRVSKRFSFPAETRDGILSVGLFGATGQLDIDGLSLELVPRGGQATTNLMLNGDFELGEAAPFGWAVEEGAGRVTPGYRSDAALELIPKGAKALRGSSLPVHRFGEIELTVAVRASGLRGSGGAAAEVYFLDEDGRPIPGPDGDARPFNWGGSFDWRIDRATINVPRGAERAVVQFVKLDRQGSVKIDDVTLAAFPDAKLGEWTPWHVADETEDWKEFSPSPVIEPKSALDASALLDPPAGKDGPVKVSRGHLVFTRSGERARFFGVVLLPTLAFPEPEQALALADRLARSGINLVKFDDLDISIGPGRSLFDDSRDDTRALDPLALARFDHLVALLKERGIYITFELIAGRRFRPGDKIAGAGGLPPGSGPAAAFDPKVRAAIAQTARLLLDHVNPETGLALKDDPVLAWVALSGEQTLFNLLDDPDALPPESSRTLRALAEQTTLGSGRRFWLATESGQWTALAAELRRIGLKAPLAGVSHWRREPEFAAAQAASGLDLIEDRIYWSAPRFAEADRWSMLWRSGSNLTLEAARKRRADRPYVVGEWCSHTLGAWALPFEGADLLMAARTAVKDDWDGLVRRGIYLQPETWGASAPGTGGGSNDLLIVPEAINGIPPVFSLLPHAASLVLRDSAPSREKSTRGRSQRRPGGSTWDPQSGRLVLDDPHTKALAGWPGHRPAVFEAEGLSLDLDNAYAVLAVTSPGPAPIAEARRLLVTAIARVEPTGLLYADTWKREVAYPGHPPMLQEPVRGSLTWTPPGGRVHAYALDNTGHRVAPVPLTKDGDALRLDLDGKSATVHWELVVE